MQTEQSMVEAAVPVEDHRPKLAFFHANARGTGCAMTMDLHPAHGQKDGCIMAAFACQKTVGVRDGGAVTYPTFDWANRICVKLGFTDLCKILQVFRGECESIEGDKGLIHRSPQYLTRICLKHLTDPVQGYAIDVYRSTHGRPDDDRHAHIHLSPSEALGLGISFENSIGIICFGIPKIVPHDTSAYEAQVRRICHATSR